MTTPTTTPQFSDFLKAAKLLYGDGPLTPAKIRDIATAEYIEALKDHAEATASAFESPEVAETAVDEAVPVRKTRVKRSTQPSETPADAEPDQVQPMPESAVDPVE